MKTYLVITDGSNEIRIPINARVEGPVGAPNSVPTPNSVPDMVSRHTKYPEEVKRNAVALVAGGARIVDVCLALGLPDSTLDNWLRKHRVARPRSLRPCYA